MHVTLKIGETILFQSHFFKLSILDLTADTVKRKLKALISTVILAVRLVVAFIWLVVTFIW